MQAAYYQLEPWGEWRADFRIAQLCALIANTNRDPKKRAKAYEASEFMVFDKADEARKRAQMQGAIEDETVQWFFARVGMKVPTPTVEQQLANVAPHLSPERRKQLEQTMRKHAN